MHPSRIYFPFPKKRSAKIWKAWEKKRKKNPLWPREGIISHIFNRSTCMCHLWLVSHFIKKYGPPTWLFSLSRTFEIDSLPKPFLKKKKKSTGKTTCRALLWMVVCLPHKLPFLPKMDNGIMEALNRRYCERKLDWWNKWLVELKRLKMSESC